MSLVRDIPAGDGKIAKLFLQCKRRARAWRRCIFWQAEVGIDTCKSVECSTSIKTPTFDRKELEVVFFQKPKISVAPSISMFKKVYCCF